MRSGGRNLFFVAVVVSLTAVSCARSSTTPRAGLNIIATASAQASSLVFRIGVENTGTSTERLTFGSSQFFDIEVRDLGGRLVWEFSYGKNFLTLVWGVALAPGESSVQEATWDLTGNRGDRLPPGQYTARVFITSSPRNEDLATVIRLTI